MNMLLYPNVIRECRVTILQIAHSLRGDGYIPIYKKKTLKFYLLLLRQFRNIYSMIKGNSVAQNRRNLLALSGLQDKDCANKWSVVCNSI